MLNHKAAKGKREAVEELARKLGFDPSGLVQVLDVREKMVERKKLEVADVASRYLAAVEHVAAAVDQCWTQPEQAWHRV